MWGNNKTDNLTAQIKELIARADVQEEKIRKLEEENRQLQEFLSGLTCSDNLSAKDFSGYAEEQRHKLWHM